MVLVVIIIILNHISVLIGIELTSENGFELSASDSIERDFDEGEIIQDAELICVGQEELERFAAEGSFIISFHS